MTPGTRRTVTTLVTLATLSLAACSGGSTETTSTTSSTTSGASATATSADTTAPTASAGTGESSAATTTGTAGAQSSSGAVAGTVPSNGKELAAAMRAASTGMYTVTTSITGEQPAKVTGRGFLADKTLAVHLDGDADTAQDVEVVAGKAYTSLGGYTTGSQRVVVDLADSTDQLREGVDAIVGAADLEKVVAAVGSATKVNVSGRQVTAIIPGRSLVALFGWGMDGSVPATAPMKVTLDEANRPVTVEATLAGAKRTSTYGGWSAGKPITAPPASAVVESPL